MAGYEFTQEQNERIKTTLTHLTRFCYFVGIVGLIGIVRSLSVMMQDGVALAQIAGVAVSIVHLVVAFVLFRPIGSFQKIVNTTGQDIEQLLIGINKLKDGFGIVIGLVAITLILVIVRVISFM